MINDENWLWHKLTKPTRVLVYVFFGQNWVHFSHASQVFPNVLRIKYSLNCIWMQSRVTRIQSYNRNNKYYRKKWIGFRTRLDSITARLIKFISPLNENIVTFCPFLSAFQIWINDLQLNSVQCKLHGKKKVSLISGPTLAHCVLCSAVQWCRVANNMCQLRHY